MIDKKIELIINEKFYNMIKKYKCNGEILAKLKFNNETYDVLFINNEIFSDFSRSVQENIGKVIINKSRIKFKEDIYEKKFINYILQNNTNIDIYILKNKKRFYSSYMLTRDYQKVGNNVYLKDLIFIEY